MFCKASSSGGGSHRWAFPFFHILHQDPPPSVLDQLAHFWVLTPHSLHLDHSLLCLCLLWHLAVPLAKDLFQALLCLLIASWLLGIPSLA